MPDLSFKWDEPEISEQNQVSAIKRNQEEQDAILRVKRERQERFRELEKQVIDQVQPGPKGLVWRKPSKKNLREDAKLKRSAIRRKLRKEMMKLQDPVEETE